MVMWVVRADLVALFLLCLAGVRAQTFTNTFDTEGVTLYRMTHSQGEKCHPDSNTHGNIECDGGLERQFQQGETATNAIPQVVNVTLRYEGTMPAHAYVSLIDSASTCSNYPHPNEADNLHSGVRQANADNAIRIPQETASGNEALLTSSKEGQEMLFKVCYSCVRTGGVGDCQTGQFNWADSG